MSKKLAERLDLSLAWKRVKEDIRDWAFIDTPYELDLIEQDLDSWLGNLKRRISENNYQPYGCIIVDVPKPNWHLRPGSILKLEDVLIYHALLLDGISHIKEKVKWSEGNRQFS